MTRISLSLCLIVLLSATSGGAPVAIKVRKNTSSSVPSTHCVSIWSVNSNDPQLTMQWVCSVFDPANPSGDPCDASMWLEPATAGQGSHLQILQAFDSTDIANNQNQATVFATRTSGGTTKLRLMVGIEDTSCPAGDYCTTVEITVSSF